MNDAVFILLVAWCLMTVIYTSLSVLFDVFLDATRKALRLAIDYKPFNIIGRIVFIPIYTIPIAILLSPSIVLYGVIKGSRKILESIMYILSIIFFKKEN